MDLKEWAQRKGYRIAWGPVSLLDEIRNELVNRHEAGEFEEKFFEKSLSNFGYLKGLSEIRTVGVVAIPRPGHLIRFSNGNRTIDAVAPPTYLDYDKTAQDLLAEMNDLVPGEEPHFVSLHAPLKGLAVRTGLAHYGRNNITFVPGMGSYHQLVGFASDLDLGSANLPEAKTPALLPLCESCSACQKACPTGAISKERFLLRGERCLAFLNEYEEAWPDWLPSTTHNCLVGCLLCQKACPQNAGLLRFEKAREEFTSDETAALLGGGSEGNERLWRAITEKLTRIGLDGYEPVLGRNLKVLLAAQTPNKV